MGTPSVVVGEQKGNFSIRRRGKERPPASRSRGNRKRSKMRASCSRDSVLRRSAAERKGSCPNKREDEGMTLQGPYGPSRSLALGGGVEVYQNKYGIAEKWKTVHSAVWKRGGPTMGLRLEISL